MEKRKERKSRSNVNIARKMDVVKAAAHAWIEHGSTSRKLISAFDTSSNDNSSQSLPPAYKPSRFKLEAVAAVPSAGSSFSPGHCCTHIKMYSLLDELEVERIMHDLEAIDDYSSRRQTKNVVGSLDIGNRLSKEIKETNKTEMSSWVKRGFACSTNVNDVVVVSSTISTPTRRSLNLPRKSKFTMHMLLQN